MAIELTALWQHADNIVGGNPRDDKQIFINDQGGIADRSGLGFFKRHFSSSARMEENHATLQAFWDAIAANPKAAAEFRAGKESAINGLKGPVMKASQGKANPRLVDEIIRRLLAPAQPSAPDL